jgi:hypothetical protein
MSGNHRNSFPRWCSPTAGLRGFSLAVIEELGPRAYRLTLSAEAPDDSGEVREITVSRNVRLQDLQLSHTLRRYFHETDPEEFPGTTPEFSSHTDNIGGDAANLELSRRRAGAVKAALIERYGISAERLTSTGYGGSQPQEKNDTPQRRARNRRVELIRT